MIGYPRSVDERLGNSQQITQIATRETNTHKQKSSFFRRSLPLLEQETRLQEDAAHRVPRGQRACKARYRPLFLI